MEFIDQCQDGIDTIVGEKGTQLSGGQVCSFGTWLNMTCVVIGGCSASALPLHEHCFEGTISRFCSWTRFA